MNRSLVDQRPRAELEMKKMSSQVLVVLDELQDLVGADVAVLADQGVNLLVFAELMKARG